jgi:thiazole/oxazole-forming peptide maturase SagC family component
MQTGAPTPKGVYRLREGVRILNTSDEEIRFRKGVWNFNEAVLRLAGQDERAVRFLKAVTHELLYAGKADIDKLPLTQDLEPQELDELCEVLDSLAQQQYLAIGTEGSVTDTVSALLGGSLSGFEPYVGTARPVMFFTDNSYAKDAAAAIARQIDLPMDVLDGGTQSTLGRIDLTTKVDALEQVRQIEELQRHFTSYCCVVGCLASPNISMLRNLNRVLIKAEIPLILGLIDGPFASVLSIVPRQSGCFECYEQRLLARLEDTFAYHQYVRSTADANGTTGPSPATSYAPALHMLAGAVISEAFLHATLSVLRLAGRTLSVYLPLLEVQVQDILRVPYCPGCGFIATAQMKEMYTSSRRLVSEMVARVGLTRSQP